MKTEITQKDVWPSRAHWKYSTQSTTGSLDMDNNIQVVGITYKALTIVTLISVLDEMRNKSIVYTYCRYLWSKYSNL